MHVDRRTQLGITDQYHWILGVTAPSYVCVLRFLRACILNLLSSHSPYRHS